MPFFLSVPHKNPDLHCIRPQHCIALRGILEGSIETFLMMFGFKTFTFGQANAKDGLLNLT